MYNMELVSGPLERVIVKLGQLLKEEYNLQTGMRKKITSLSSDLESMRVALRKVADVPPQDLDEEVKLWASKVRELAYDAEDVLDCFLIRVEGREARDSNRFKSAWEKISKPFSKIKDRHQIDSMIKIINEQAKELAERRERYKVGKIVAKPASSSTVDPRLAAMYTEVTKLVGIEESSGELVSMLSLQGADKPTNKIMKMVSVFGAGGLGKTTLAKAVFDKFKVDFECGAFVSVGRNPDLKKVFRDILLELDKDKYMNSVITIFDEKQLSDEIRKYLGTNRYE